MVLVAKFPNVSASTIQSLGSQCVGLTAGQISSAPPDVINSSLSVLSQVNGWDQGQVNSLIQSIISAGFTVSVHCTLVRNVSLWHWKPGHFYLEQLSSCFASQISSASSLEFLGTLLGGVPSATISTVPSSQLVSLSQNPTFIHHLVSAPVILQKTFVQKVFSLSYTSLV